MSRCGGAPAAGARPVRRRIAGGGCSQKSGEELVETSAAYQFCFGYPPDLHASEAREGNATTVRVRDAARTIGFQVYIRPIGGQDTAITPERLARDLPGVAIRNPKPMHLPGAGKGLAFYATDRTFGQSFQVWFIREGHLYQLSCYAPHDALVRQALATWAFST